jgi:TatD DNase family protein
MLIDCHVYLRAPHRPGDQEDMIRRASEADVRSMFTVGTDLVSSREAMAHLHRYGSVYAVVGVYPHHVKDME